MNMETPPLRIRNVLISPPRMSEKGCYRVVLQRQRDFRSYSREKDSKAYLIGGYGDDTHDERKVAKRARSKSWAYIYP